MGSSDAPITIEVDWFNTSKEKDFWNTFSGLLGGLTNAPGRVLAQVPNRLEVSRTYPRQESTAGGGQAAT